MQYIGKIDREIYQCVTKDIVTEDVIITDEQITHIKERHPKDYERYYAYFQEVHSVITFMKINEKRWNRYLRTKDILYKKE